MTKKAFNIYPASAKEMEAMGQRLKDARLRRRFSMETVCARADISRPTLNKAENGDPSVLNGDFQFGLAVETGIVKRYLIILFRPGSRLYASRGVVCVQ